MKWPRAAAGLLACVAFALLGATSAQASPGDLDGTFSADGLLTTGFSAHGPSSPQSMARQPDGKIVLASGTAGRMSLARINADGSLDSGFGSAGKASVALGSAIGVGLQSDGKIVVAFAHERPGGVQGNYFDFGAARFTSAGALDTTFGTNGTTTLDLGGNDYVHAMAIQSDDKILLVGEANGGSSTFALARLTANGSPDTSFSGDGIQTTDFGLFGGASAVAVQPDGKIVVAGSGWDSPNTPVGFAVARYDSVGALDTSFSGDGKAVTDFSIYNDEATAIAIQSDGKVVVGGTSGSGSGGAAAEDFGAARYNSDGSPDNSFSGDGKQTVDWGGADWVNAVAVDSNGSVVLAGANGVDFQFARLTSAGDLDSSFSGDGMATSDFGGPAGFNHEEPNAVIALAAGSFIVAGTGGPYNEELVAQYSSDASLDTSFSTDGYTIVGFPGADRGAGLAAQADGKLVAAIQSDGNAFLVARYKTDGVLDPSFSSDGLTEATFLGSDRPVGIAVQPDGKIVVGGSTPLGDIAVARFNSDGSPDSTFAGDGTALVTFASPVNASAFALAPDGKIIVGGFVNPSFALAIARLKTDGTVDPAFSGDGFQTVTIPGGLESVTGLTVDSSARVLAAFAPVVGGAFDLGLLRLDAAGELDPSFSGDGILTTDLGGSEITTAVELDGSKVVVAGWNDDVIALARYTDDGTLDSSFSGDGLQTTALAPPTHAGGLVIDSAHRPVVIGDTGDPSRWLVARYTSAGNLDPSFAGDGLQMIDFGLGAASPDAVVLEPDGTIAVSGSTAGPESFDFALARFEGGSGTTSPDTTPPTITIGSPSDGQHFEQGQSVRSSFSCDDGAGSGVASCSGAATVDTATAGPHEFTVKATDHAANASSKTVTYSVDPPPAQPSSGAADSSPRVGDPPLAPARAPIRGRSATLAHVSGTVLVRRPGSSTLVALTEESTLPTGTLVDARKGTVTITLAPDAKGRVFTARARLGEFILRLSATGATMFELAEPLSGCPHSTAATDAKKRKKGAVKRTLWVHDSGGKWGTRGQYAAGTTLGTTWTTTDTCSRTSFKVGQGALLVKPLEGGRAVKVKAPRSYVVRGG